MILFNFKLITKMQSIDQLSVQDKISMIRNKYKTTKDLWTYMTERRKSFLLLSYLIIIFCSRLVDAFFEELQVVAHLGCSFKEKEGSKT